MAQVFSSLGEGNRLFVPSRTPAVLKYLRQWYRQARQQRCRQHVLYAQQGPLHVCAIAQLQLGHRVVARVYGPVFQDASFGVNLPLAYQIPITVRGQYFHHNVGRAFNSAASHDVTALVEDDDYVRLRSALQFAREARPETRPETSGFPCAVFRWWS